MLGQPVCKNCGQEHAPWTSDSTTHSTRLTQNLTPSECKVKQEIVDNIYLVKLLTDGARSMGTWNVHMLHEMEEAVQSLSKSANVSCNLFPEKNECNVTDIIAKLEVSYEALGETEAEGFEEVLGKQISALKLLHCKVYPVNNDKVKDAAENVRDEVTNEPEPEAEAVDRKQDCERRPADIATAKRFNGRYHYRRVNKCLRCATVKSMDKDCFFLLDFHATGNTLDKCTSCKRTGYKCQFAGDDFADDLIEAGFSKPQVPSQKKIPPSTASTTAAATSTSVSHPPISTITSPAFTTAATGPSESVPPLHRRAAVVTPTSASTMTRESNKRKATSAPQGSNPLKHRRADDCSQPSVTPKPDAADAMSRNIPVDRATMLRQVSRLTTSFESFTDVTLRRVESDRKRRLSEQDPAMEERKLAYKESKQLCEERLRASMETLRVYKESMRAYEESVPIFEEKRRIFKENEQLYAESHTATQEWLAARSASAGEDIIQEATSLLSSIEQDSPIRDIATVLQRLRTVFAEFQRVQGFLSEEHRFKGLRAQVLYTLMETIHKEIDREVPVEI